MELRVRFPFPAGPNLNMLPGRQTEADSTWQPTCLRIQLFSVLT